MHYTELEISGLESMQDTACSCSTSTVASVVAAVWDTRLHERMTLWTAEQHQKAVSCFVRLQQYRVGMHAFKKKLQQEKPAVDEELQLL